MVLELKCGGPDPRGTLCSAAADARTAATGADADGLETSPARTHTRARRRPASNPDSPPPHSNQSGKPSGKWPYSLKHKSRNRTTDILALSCLHVGVTSGVRSLGSSLKTRPPTTLGVRDGEGSGSASVTFPSHPGPRVCLDLCRTVTGAMTTALPVACR